MYSGTAGDGGNGDLPRPHNIDNDTIPVFNSLNNNFLTCPSGLANTGKLLCDVNLCKTTDLCNDDPDELDSDNSIGKRSRRTTTLNFGPGQSVVVTAQNYPSIGALLQGPNGQQVFNRAYDFVSRDCSECDTIDHDIDGLDMSDFVTEHVLELQTVARFIRSAVSGQLPSGATMTVGTVSVGFFVSTWATPNTLRNLPRVGLGTSPTNLNDRVFEALGSSSNREDFIICEKQLNAFKGKLFKGQLPYDLSEFKKEVLGTIQRGDDPKDWLQRIRLVLEIFSYMNDVNVLKRLRQANGLVHDRKSIHSSLSPPLTCFACDRFLELCPSFTWKALVRFECQPDLFLRQNSILPPLPYKAPRICQLPGKNSSKICYLQLAPQQLHW